MSRGDKTEKPTQQRRTKAREQGQVARSREISGALACAAAIWLLYLTFEKALVSWRAFFRTVLESSSRMENAGTLTVLQHSSHFALAATAIPLLTVGFVAIFATTAQGGFVFSPAVLAPKLNRISPASRAKQLFSLSTVSSLLKSLVPGAAITALLISLLSREWPRLISASAVPLNESVRMLGALLFELAWKSTLVMLIWSAIDYFLIRQKLEGDLRMTKEEVREELKQSEGNPATKARIRRIQRQVRRSRMLHALEEATVVVTNPTHFAVALKYTPAMAAPVVVAKGQNLLARELKRKAYWLGIVVVENKPLAQTLYRSVDIGRSIPADLYSAVAEVLAFVFRIQAASTSTRNGGQQ